MLLCTFVWRVCWVESDDSLIVITVVSILVSPFTWNKNEHVEIAVTIAAPSPIDMYQPIVIDTVEYKGVACTLVFWVTGIKDRTLVD